LNGRLRNDKSIPALARFLLETPTIDAIGMVRAI